MQGSTPPSRPLDVGKGRIIILFLILGTIFIVYVSNLFSLQIVKGWVYQDRARRVSQRLLTIPSQRGEIYDRNADVPIVINVDSYAVDIIPAEVPNGEIENLMARLSGILSVPVEEIRKKLTPAMYHLYQPVEIAHKIANETIYFLAEHID